MNENSSDTTSSVEHVLVNYKKKMKEDSISNSLSVESSLNSNINININMPSTSENAGFLLSVQSGAATKGRKRNVKKKTKKVDSSVSVNVENNNENENEKLSNVRKTGKKTSKTAGNKSSKRPRNNESQNAKDPDYKPSGQCNYLRLSSKELNSIAKRVRIFHETGIVVSDDEDVIGCKNKYKKGNKKNQPRQQSEQVPGTQFGQGRVGTVCGGYGVRKCGCCNIPKNNSLLHFCSTHSSTNLSQDVLNSIKRREERLLQVQQQELLRHPELANIGDDDGDDDEQHIEPPEFSRDKRELVQKFIDSMSADRVDYEKPRQVNIVGAVEQKRPSAVVPKQEGVDLITSIDNKTIVERVDFKSKHSGGRQRTIDEWLRGCSSISKSQDNLPIATSTPRHAVNLDLNETYMSSIPGPSNINLNVVANVELTTEDSRKGISKKVERNIFEDIIATNIEEPFDDINSIDISHLDRSNITLRTPHSKSISYRNNPSSSKPIFEENDDIMDFVDNLLSHETETINQEVNERCEKWLEDNRRNQDLLQNALDSVIVINDDDIPHMHDDSVEIISDDLVDLPVNPGITNSIVEVDDDDAIIPVINISDSTNPSTSRSTRGRRKLTRRKGLRRQAQSVPPEQPPTFVKPVEPVVSVKKQPAEESDIKVENRGLRDCPICLENMENKEISATICGHIFCTPCITAAVRSNRSCPNCRASLTLKKIHPLFI